MDFSNILKRGDLKVTKTSEDGLVEGMKFHLYGTSLSGIPVDEYAVTDSAGVAMFSDILISGDTPYTLEEVETADRYVVPADQSVTVNWNEVTNATVHNVLKKFRVTVAKTDRETGTPQGDATLAGAVYGIYDGGYADRHLHHRRQRQFYHEILCVWRQLDNPGDQPVRRVSAG